MKLTFKHNLDSAGPPSLSVFVDGKPASAEVVDAVARALNVDQFEPSIEDATREILEEQ